MTQNISSRSLLGASEITLVADILPGFVPIPDVTAYSARLRTVLRTLFEIRKAAIESDGRFSSAGPLESLRMLHAIHWALLENDRRLLLAVSFDGPWEPYIRGIVDMAGPLLDLIFCHCVDYRGHMCADGYAPFAEWVRAHQQSCDFFYKAAPDVTVDDLRYLQAHEQGVPPGYHVGDLGELPLPLRMRLAGVLSAKLERLFPAEQPASDRDDASVFQRARALFVGEKVAVQPPARVPNADALEEDTQGNILTSYMDHAFMTMGSVSLLHFEDAAAGATFLRGIKKDITTEAKAPAAAVKLNVALTLRGLKTLGMPPQELALLPVEFKEGMAARAGMLGDVAQNHPDKWSLPTMNLDADSSGERVNLATVDAIVMLEQVEPAPQIAPANDPHHAFSNTHPHYPTIKAWNAAGVQVLHVQALRRYGLGGHFKLADGLSQPVPDRATNPAKGIARDRVALGEILLGHANNRGDEPQPHLDHVFKNGSFLVLRKIEQNVPAFDEFVKNNASPDFITKIVGRDRAGNAAVTGKMDNDFDYRDDPNGVKCPLHAHIRRANPRAGRPVVESVAATAAKPLGERNVSLAPTPRIVRRGMSFGPQAGADRKGLMFMAYQASIAEQFEVVQRWINGGNSTGVLSAHPDLLAGNFPGGSNRVLSSPNADGSICRIALPPAPVTTLNWGIYAFVPSMTGLDALIEPPPVMAVRAGDPQPPPFLSPLLELDRQARNDPPQKDAAVAAWKDLLENSDRRAEARALWRYIRQTQPLRTSYGLLVGSASGVEKVLADHGTFSVREYWKRLEKAFGGHYLGMDPAPKAVVGDTYDQEVAYGQYQAESELPNRYLSSICAVDAFQVARAEMLKRLDEIVPANGRKTVNLVEEARVVIGRISSHFLGMPDGQQMLAGGDDISAKPPSRCPADFTRVSQFVFNPRPTATLTEVATNRGAVVKAAVPPFVNSQNPGKLCTYLRDQGFAHDQARALIGSINGFVVPTTGAFVSAVIQWLESEELWRLQRWLLGAPAAAGDPRERLRIGDGVTSDDFKVGKLWEALARSMTAVAVPDLLHRKAVDEGAIDGFPVHAGEDVVISLASAAAHQGDWTLLFGGDRVGADVYPLHACPGQDMAIGVLIGMFSVLLQQKNLTRFGGPVVLIDA